MVSVLRRVGVFIAISSLYFLVSFSIASATSWIQDGASWGSASQYMDFAINPSTYEKYVAYEDGSSMTVKRFDGSSWVVVGTAMFTDPTTGVGDISLAFNASTSEPYVAYSETHVNGEGYMTYTSPHVKRFDGSSWVDVGLPAIYATGVHAGGDISLAFNPSTNEPYIAYERYIYTVAGYTHGGAIQRFDGSSWVYVGGGGDGEIYSGVGMMRDIELIFNPSTFEPYIAYIDYANANSYELNMKRFDGSSWVYVGAPSFSVGSGKTTGTSFAFNPSTNQPYVAYADPGDFNNAYVMEFDGSTWSTVGTAGFNNGKGGGTRGLGLAFNPANNMPYVVYPGAVSKFNGTSWVLVGGTSLSATENDSLMSIVFDPSTNQPSITSSRLAFSFSEPIDRVELPVASLPGEMYTGTQTITLSTATAGATIYYTVDGSTPTASSNLYSGAISITSSTNLKAIAVKSGLSDSDVMSESYLISSWVAVGVEDFTPRQAQNIRIAFNPLTSEPYVTYMDFMTDNYRQSVKRYSTTTDSWEGVGAEGFHIQRVDMASLAFNPDTNKPYLFLPGSDSIVSRFDGSNWIQVGGSFGFYTYAYPNKIAFNPITNEPYIVGSYYSNSQGGRMTVKKFDGSSWVTVGSEGISSTTVSNVDMVFDPITGEPYVSYAINECLPSCPAHSVLHVKKFDGSSWVDIVSEPDYGMASLAFHSIANDLYLYIADGSLMKLNGASLETVAPSVGSFAQNTKLIVNPITHEIYVGYVEWPSFVGYLKKLVGSSWVLVGSTTLSSGDVQSVDFAFNPTTNEPYIAYTSASSPYKATVKKFPMSQAEAPVASPVSGSFSSAQSVTLSSVTSSSSIYYTVDGSTPTTNSNLYSGAVSITSSTTLRAIAVRTEYIDSPIMSESYFVQTATPSPSVSGGTFSSPQSIQLSSLTAESIIYYTTDGSTPTTSSTVYVEAISIASTTNLKAVAIKSGIPDSTIMTETYTITPSTTPTVTTGSATSIAQTTVTLG
ncbi:MAG: chitobiase/beta-hexosaminidase C-terminal domain-containing protein, partial [Candidatus Kaiserbacteria bacterium]|nr:chitobiase/beta-hexosaminidase C-terminal domain-containing protein [Candidatus Kaiserbacteria bacterium]